MTDPKDDAQKVLDFSIHLKFNGSDYDPARDNRRLTGQLLRVWDLMKDQRWRTLKELAVATGDPEASVSAQLRHLRKPRFGGHIVEKEHIRNGLFRYRVIVEPNGQGEIK